LKRHFDSKELLDVHYMDGTNDPDKEIAEYGAKVTEKPIDIVFMGIGENGHIAFNDPGVADFEDPAIMKIARLDDVCRMQQVHDGCFADIASVPQYALTLTIPALISAEKVFCIVPAENKAEALKHAMLDAVSPDFPATILRTKKGTRVYADQSSFSLLEQAMPDDVNSLESEDE
jgi:glucosamine-6-phosphate deaminase